MGFRPKGLEEIHLTGKTRRIGVENIRKCVRILQLLEAAAPPEDLTSQAFASTDSKAVQNAGRCA